MCQWKSWTPTGLVGRYWKGKRYGTLVVSGPFLSVDLCEGLDREMGFLVAVVWQRAHRWRPGVMKVLPSKSVISYYEET